MKEGLLIVIIVLFVASCSNSLKNDSKDQSGKVINVQKASIQLNFVGHWLYQAKREDLVREIANEYEFLNQNCKVNLVFPEDIYYSRSKADCEEEFVSQQLLAEHSKYDIIRINDAYLKIALYMKDPDWAKKYLVDFSQYPEFNRDAMPELVNDSAKSKWKGMIPGPYLEGYNYSIWYDRDLAKEIGIQVKQLDMTFEDLLQYVKTIDAYNKSHNTNIIPIHECSDWSTINPLAFRLFLSELDDWRESLKDNYSERKLNAFHKTLKAFEELSKYHAYSKSWKQTEFMNSLDYPMKHKSFFYVNASWMYNYWQKIASKEALNMVPNELPVFKPSPVYFGGYSVMWAVPKNAPNRDEAVKFLLFMNKPDVAEKWSRYAKCPTGIKGNVTSVSFGKDHFEDFTYNIDKKYGSRKLSFNYFDNNLVLGVSRNSVNMHTIDVATGIMTAEEAMLEIRKQLKKNK